MRSASFHLIPPRYANGKQAAKGSQAMLFRTLTSSIFGQPLMWFDADGGGAGGAGGDGKAKADPAPKTFTQVELDEIIGTRLTRAEEKVKKDLLDSLGVKTVEDAKAALKAKQELDDAAKTEAQKLADRATTAEAKVLDLEKNAQERITAMGKRLMDSEIKMTAGAPAMDDKGKVTRPALLAAAMDEVLLLVDRAKIEEKDGKYTGIDKALEALAKAKPHLTVQAGTGRPDRKGTPNSQDLPAGNQQPQAKKRRFSL